MNRMFSSYFDGPAWTRRPGELLMEARRSLTPILRRPYCCRRARPFIILVALVLTGVSSTLPRAGASGTNQAGSISERFSATAAGSSFLPTFSPAGQGVAFLSHANNLVTNDDRGVSLDLFWHDLTTRSTELISVSVLGHRGADQDVLALSISSNAQMIAFETSASNLTAGDDNAMTDIFVRDRVAGITRLVSVDVTGTRSGNGRSFNPQISADGRYVVFESTASDLVRNDFNGTNDVFIRDLFSGTTTLVSATDDGSRSANDGSHSPAMTPDGRYVAFVSHATNLIEGVTNRLGEVYVRDLVTGSNHWAAASHLQIFRFPAGGSYQASRPVLSADGRFVAFKASGRVVRFDTQRPTNTVRQAFPEAPGQTNYFSFQDNPRVSAFPEGLQAADLAVSADGRYAAVATGTNEAAFSAVYRIDFETLIEQVRLVMPDGGGVGGPMIPYFQTNLVHIVEMISSNAVPIFPRGPSLSDDGSRIAFLDAAMITNNAGNVQRQVGVWMRDMMASSAWLLSTNRQGASWTDNAFPAPALSRDGSKVAWESLADDLIEPDDNRAWDVFVREIATGELQAASIRHADLPSSIALGLTTLTPQALSADGRQVAFLSLDSNLGRNDTNRLPDAYVYDRSANANQLISTARGIQLGPPFYDSNYVGHVSLSADGRYAAFSWLGVRIEQNPPRYVGLFWRDLAIDRSLVVAAGFSLGPIVLGPDGRLVAFHSAQILDPAVWGANQQNNIYLQWMDTNSSSRLVRSPMAVSTVPDNSMTGNGASLNASFSPDGSWIVFQSTAGDLTLDSYPPSLNTQLMARWFEPGQITLSTPVRLISYTTTASSLPDGRSLDAPLRATAQSPQFSADSRYVVFETSSNVVYRHDLYSGFVRTVSSNRIDGALVYFTNYARVTNTLVCTGCGAPSISGDGRYVGYEARPSGGGIINLFLKDLVSDQIERISSGLGGAEPDGSSFRPLLSHDARYVVFTSKASNLVRNDTNKVMDVFVRDRFAGVTFAISSSSLWPGTGNRVSSDPVLSADGRTVAFQSFASDLVPGDYNETRDVFLLTLSGPDSDHDGMDDDWEMAYFNTLSRDGTGDQDGDGASDRDEFRAGTNPVNDASILRVLKLMIAPNDLARTTVLLWSAVPGRTYRVQTKTAVEENWTDLPADVIATSYSAQASDRVEDGLPRFYRVRLVE